MMMTSLLVSCRKNFTDPDRMNCDHRIRLTANNIEIGMDQFKAMLATGRRILVLVHGYNSRMASVTRVYRRIEAELGLYYDYVVGYLWPGGDHAWEWTIAKRNAMTAAGMLAGLLEEIGSPGSGREIDVLTHSLGARVCLSALQRISGDIIRNCYLTAPAVEDEVFEIGREFPDCPGKCRRLFIFHSKNDDVLKLAFGPAELDTALGLLGPEDICRILRLGNVFVINCKYVVNRHAGYVDSTAVMDFLKAALHDRENEIFRTLSRGLSKAA